MTQMMKKIFVAAGAIALIFAACASCTRIDAGYEGILVNQYGSERGFKCTDSYRQSLVQPTHTGRY